MDYDVDKFIYRDFINSKIPDLREEFLRVHGTDTTDTPLYPAGSYAELDIHKKWKMLILKNMGQWDEENIHKYPVLKSLADYFGERCRSIGISILDPGAEVLPHTDTEEGFQNYIIVHVPLIVPQGDCGFEENGVKGRWVEGECFILNVELSHSVWNFTDGIRVVVLMELEKAGSYEF